MIETKLTAIAQNCPKLFAAGKQAFWDSYRPYEEYPGSYDCSYLFAGRAWSDENFNPAIIPQEISTAYMMFAKNRITDLRHLPPISVGNFQYMFYQNQCTRHVGQLIAAWPTDPLYGLFFDSAVETVEKLTVGRTNQFLGTFQRATQLRQIRFDGVIGADISFGDCPKLSEGSVQSVIDHMADLTGQTPQTLTLHESVKEKLTDAQIAALRAKNWLLA